MNLQEIEITIDKEGRVNMKVNGAHGDDCLVLTRDLENAVGVVEQREYSAEYYEQPSEVRGHQRNSFS